MPTRFTTPDGRTYETLSLSPSEGTSCRRCCFCDDSYNAACTRQRRHPGLAFPLPCTRPGPDDRFFVWTEVTSPATDELED